MDLHRYIQNGFPEGLRYNEAAQLCLRLYCSLDGLPEELHTKCTKDGLADAFSKLADEGFLSDEPLASAIYGANFHHTNEKGHWVEVIASIFKKENIKDLALGELLVHRLTSGSNRSLRSLGRAEPAP